ncbi:polymorphic toxin-type HINT domain-containing protein [Nocardia sp. NRRL S-836]|uniref:polymorphic toxin-type HINT domain-containing protein n=1 Tax=Nocardia sp. NRRL S-836 TaxID=1519492 RepID=UPI0006B00A66|nr:polymorphic toxin-type HINT domain-containing protein [Nocardia sp. NRRL S-836]
MRSTTRTFRGIAAALAVSMLVSAINLTDSPTAFAVGGPSVPLPDVPSVSVSAETRQSRNPDEATTRALQNNQPANTGGRPDGGGSFTATPLSPTGAWTVSAQSGDFSWSYPMRVPPAPGGFAPSVGLSYRSSLVDGRTSATNNQPGWAGDGWSLGAGFIQRTYGACNDDTEGTTPPRVGDLCWRSDNATASYPGGGGDLIKDDGDPTKWRQKSDNAARIERITGSGGPDNGDNDREHWKITTVDGTQYFFGSRPESQSTWTVPVFGDDANEPCNNTASFDSSWCDQGWRWNLDKAIDRNGNVILYNYVAEKNKYSLNLKDAGVTYTRGGALSTIEYGLNERVQAPASGKVVFSTAERCVPGSNCSQASKENFPDVPLEEKCDAATCRDHWSPTFWSTKRLAKVTAQVLRGDGSYGDVDSWTLDHQFPDTRDGNGAALWLKGIKHTGHVGQAIDLPQVTFEGQLLNNRVPKNDSAFSINRYRVNAIVTESGGVTTIKYADTNCNETTVPASAQSNTLRCYPVTWRKKDFSETLDHFHKYVVESITSSDATGINTEQLVRYEYLDGVAWRFDQSEFVKNDKKTWDDYRGYGRVRVRVGKPDVPGAPVTMTEQRFYRGMDGNKGDTAQRKVSDTAGGERVDHDWLAGLSYETITYEGESDTVSSKVISTPEWQGPTATRGIYQAYLVGGGTTDTYTALKNRGWRQTRVKTTVDQYGQVTKTDDLGDLAVTTDDLCSTQTYVRNTSKWLMVLPHEAETVSVSCDTPPVFPGHAVSASRSAYDGQDFGAAPQYGNMTRTQVAKSRPAAEPEYITKGTFGYDEHGRVTTATDALDHTSTVEHTPKTGGPLTKTVTTNAAGQKATKTYEPAWGAVLQTADSNVVPLVTTTEYDALGRSVRAWNPLRPKADYPNDPSARFEYNVRKDGPTVVTSSTIGPNGRYVSSKILYDGLYRVRQTQTPADGGRLIVDTRYDTHGRSARVTQPFFNNNPIDDSIVVASENDMPGFTRSEYDNVGRAVKTTHVAGPHTDVTTTAYEGDRVFVSPPQGGTPTTTIFDARGRKTALLQYKNNAQLTDYERTEYGYTPAGQPASAKDAAGNVWRWHHDLLGRLVKSEDVDKGTSTSTYNDANQLVTTTDARNTTLTYAYDQLGRPSTVHNGATLLREQTYDTATNGVGLPASTTSYTGGNAYRSAVQSYNGLGQPKSVSTTIPDVEGALRGEYKSFLSYGPDGSLQGESYPAVPSISLAAETIKYVFDDLGRPTTTNGKDDYVTASTYTRYGELSQLQLGKAGARTWLSYYYDINKRRMDRYIVDAEVASPMQADIRYSYDQAGNVLSVTDALAGDQLDRQCFRYDHLQRLTEAWTPSTACDAEPAAISLAGPAPYWHSYTYDPAGNRKTEVQHALAGDTTRTYDYPRGHELASVTTAKPGLTTLDRFTYDASGNTKTRNLTGVEQTLDWDVQGRLATVSEGTAKQTEFVHGADGSRLLRRDPDATTLYLGGQELRLAKGATKPTVTRYYSHGGKVVAMREGLTKITWLAADHQGTAQIAVDKATLNVDRRRQLPFGTPRGAAVPFPGERGFVGGTVDASTGLVSIGARQYDPAVGRFVSVDPIMDGSDPQQWNGYAYSNNSPITLSDPSGMLAMGCMDDGPCGSQGVRESYTPLLGSDAPGGMPVKKQVNYQARYQKGVQDAFKETYHTAVEAVDFVGSCRVSVNASLDVKLVDPGKCSDAIDTAAQGVITFGSDPGGTLINGVIAAADPVVQAVKDEDYGYAIGRGVVIVGESVVGSKGLGNAGKGLKGTKALAKACSFVGDTTVLMADGNSRKIEEIKVGDEVVAGDPITGALAAHSVVGTFVTDKDRSLVDISVSVAGEKQVIKTTEIHPFYSVNQSAWVNAGMLQSGDRLRTAEGETAEVVGIVHHESSKVDTTYNLAVAVLPTFHVSDGRSSAHFLVHNTCGKSFSRDYGGPDFIMSEIDEAGALTYVIEGGEKTRGSTMFADMMNALGPNVRSIKGNWYSTSDNLVSFNAGVQSMLSLEEAAAETFTGKMAAKYGFTRITVNKRDLIGVPGNYTQARVTFSK